MARKGADLRAELARFTAPRCRMMHEQVARDRATGAPIRHPASDSGYARRPLCPAARRDTHLACGHTNARNRFLDLLAQLRTTGRANGDLDGLIESARALDLETALLDHRKGDAELAAARAEDADAAAAAHTAIAALEAEHDRLVDRWRELQTTALALEPLICVRTDADERL